MFAALLRIVGDLIPPSSGTVKVNGKPALVIDMVDAKTNKVVWRGWAQDSMTGVIDNQTRLEKQIDEAVTKMMKELPNHL